MSHNITYYESEKIFSIQTPNASYFLKVDKEGGLRNLYWGGKIENPTDVEFELEGFPYAYHFPHPYREEFLTRHRQFYDEPCLLAEFADGTRDVRLQYKSHEISKTETGEKLTIVLQDEYYAFSVELNYLTYQGIDLLSKNAVIINYGKNDVKLTKMQSGTMYTAWNRPMRLMYMDGRWGREYQKKTMQLQTGRFCLDNKRGVCAGPHYVPFFALDEGDATETQGNVWYGALHWSGNFKIEFERTYTNQLTVTAGVNDFDCEMILGEGQRFETPLFSIGFSDGGYEKMSETLYDFQFDFLAPQNKVKKIFPVIYNSWYPYEFDVNEENCLGLIDKAKEIGAELFVIDDGWFTNRENEKTGLGDWECDLVKFPHGLKIIADKAHEKGMLFGLWVEPEMVNEESELYRKHPEWVLRYPNRSKTKMRYQCVLNLAREDVKEFVWNVVDRIISEYSLDYLKWDMNTYITEAGDSTYEGNQKEIWVKFTENLYEIWRRMNEKYPHVLYECCAHGGARSDYGMIPYSDRINRSDNADPVDVLKLHEGFTTYLLPKYAGGAGNLATSPNGINGRVSPLKYRAYLGMTGSMSIGVNLLKTSQEELDEIRKYLEQYKEIREITQQAYVYRLASAFDGPYTVWEYLKRDRTEGVLFVFVHGMSFKDEMPRMRLRGLEAHEKYQVSGFEKYVEKGFDTVVREKELEWTAFGDTLMKFGISLAGRGDYDCQLIRIKKVN